MKTQEEIIEINKKQREYYNKLKTNFITRFWYFIRESTLKKIKNNIGIGSQAYELHKEWFGDLSTKKVLDLGCFAGNALTIHLASNAKEYIGIDLSDIAIARLNERLKDIPTAKALAVDFLSDVDFPDNNFDLIYAYGVLHHFQNTDLLINKLQDKLTKNGQVISYDPLETSLPIKIIRVLYRPFQSDSEWEWPFTKKTVKKFSDSFIIKDRRGILGKSKWFFLLNFTPMSEAKKLEIGKRWHKEDWDNSKKSDKVMFSCMHITMLMQKK